MGPRDGEDAADCGPQPPVSGGGWQAGQVEGDRERGAENVAVRGDDSGGEVPGVNVDGHDWSLPQVAQ
jgi:hypothetical protein